MTAIYWRLNTENGHIWNGTTEDWTYRLVIYTDGRAHLRVTLAGQGLSSRAYKERTYKSLTHGQTGAQKWEDGFIPDGDKAVPRHDVPKQPALAWSVSPRQANVVRAESADWRYSIITGTDGRAILTVTATTAPGERGSETYKRAEYKTTAGAQRGAQGFEETYVRTGASLQYRHTTGRKAMKMFPPRDRRAY